MGRGSEDGEQAYVLSMGHETPQRCPAGAEKGGRLAPDPGATALEREAQASRAPTQDMAQTQKEEAVPRWRGTGSVWHGWGIRRCVCWMTAADHAQS